MNTAQETHAFSIELRQKNALKTMTIPSDEDSSVLIEGFLGDLQSMCMVEDALLEIHGSKGTFRIDVKMEDLRRLLQPKPAEVNP